MMDQVERCKEMNISALMLNNDMTAEESAGIMSFNCIPLHKEAYKSVNYRYIVLYVFHNMM